MFEYIFKFKFCIITNLIWRKTFIIPGVASVLTLKLSVFDGYKFRCSIARELSLLSKFCEGQS